MINFIYSTLALLGYTHPIHAPATHLPMGMIVGGFMFKLASLKWKNFTATAGYCYALALLAVPPIAVLGIMDWQHRLFGQMNQWIAIKFTLTPLLILALSLTVYLNIRQSHRQKLILVLYIVCLVLGAGLGYVGGELAY